MRLGISTYTYTWAVGVPGHPPPAPLTALGLLDRAAELGVDVLQIADNMPLHEMAGADLSRLKERADELGVLVEVGTRGIEPGHLGAYVDLAVRFGSPILRVVVDTDDHRPTEDEMVAALREQIGRFADAGVCLAIENHDRFAVEALARIIERIGSDAVGVCLDTANSFGALEGPEKVVAVLGPLTVNLHVKDIVVRRVEGQMGFVIEGRAAGCGMLDVPWLLREVRRHGRDPSAIIELWTPPEDTLAATVAKEAAWAEASVRYLKGVLDAEDMTKTARRP